MMFRRLFIVLLFWGLSVPCFSQNKDDVNFGFYLFEMRKFDDLLLLFKDIQFNDTSTLDSIHHILGMSYYYRKELEKSAFYLSNVSPSSAFYDKSIFFSALDFAHLGEFAKARNVLENYQATHNDKHE
jgi:hypothetical protein